MKTLLLTFPMVALPLALSACTPGVGSQFSSQATISGARIDVSISRFYDKTTKALKRVESRYTLQQPQVSFITSAGSVGGRIVNAQVTINDESGNRYADTSGNYIQAFGERLWQGYACKNASGAVIPDVDPTTCTYTNRVEYTRQQSFPNPNNTSSVQLITPRIAEEATSDCVNGPCPANLTANVVFNVIDDLGRTQTITVNKAPILVFRLSDTGVEE